MAITRVGETEGSAIDDADITLDLTAISLLENDVVVIAASGGTVAPAMTTAGYTQTGVNAGLLAWKRMSASPDSSALIDITGTGGAVASAAVAIAFRGVDTTTAMDATITSATGSSTNPDSPSITTVTDGAAVISAMASLVSDASVTAPSGYGDQVDINSSDTLSATAGMAWLTKASAGAENPASWTNVSTGAWVAFTVALRPVAAPPAGVSPNAKGRLAILGARP